MKAMWRDVKLAESNDTISFEGHHYFPPGNVHWEFLVKSGRKGAHPQMGEVVYYDLDVKGVKVKEGAWYFNHPQTDPIKIKDYIAFLSDNLEII